MQTTTIYALCCPHTGSERYVGRTVMAPGRRLTGHLSKAKSGVSSLLYVWLRSLGVRPKVKVLEVTQGDGSAEERKHIALLTAAGNHLVNATSGGNGGQVRRGLPPQAKAMLGVVSDARIAEQFKVSRKKIAYHRQRAGIPPSGDRSRCFVPQSQPGYVPHNKVELPVRITSLLGEVSDRELARQAGVSKEVIQSRRRAAGIPPTTEQNRPTGEAHQGSKLTSEQVQSIRDEYIPYSREHGCGAIARRLGLNISTIHAIVRGETWKTR